MKKSFVGLLSAVLAVSALAAPPTFAQQAAAASATGELRADGQLTVSVRGLVLAPAEPVPGNLQGTNPAPTFHAVISCQSVDDSGAPMLASVRTADVPASPSGDADISATVTLPQPCLAPIVFVSGGAGVGSWFAATGIE